jgi:hypothetical protein
VRIDAVHLKDVLRQINANRRNLHVDAPPSSMVADTSTLAHRCRREWGRPSHCNWPNSAITKESGLGRAAQPQLNASASSTARLL